MYKPLAALRMIEKIESSYTKPWIFENGGEQMFSPDRQYRMEYGTLIEIVQGSPLAGKCYLVDNSCGKHLINDLCGGPPIWNAEGNKVAIPVWKRTLLIGTIQKILIIDIDNQECILFKKKFREIDFKSFNKNIIYGIDSPVHKIDEIHFDLNKEEVQERNKIKNYLNQQNL
ncbi:hypothetical protein [Adhaeribacter radiodurans]|uniref:Uncharacterized protein n=1 Tax=Adhaeribacter radiodurans TaxID=2745197 RepID=A0A7L7L822_9BACT|nr:hypothetical protein [Adhaeribacter radiodurans]QMU28685.1 hypothetical protein HUW48_11845 [Adhaeribacter radiodurans]